MRVSTARRVLGQGRETEFRGDRGCRYSQRKTASECDEAIGGSRHEGPGCIQRHHVRPLVSDGGWD